METLSDAGVWAQLARPIAFSRPLRASLLWLDEPALPFGGNAAVTESERAQLLDEFTRALRWASFENVSIIPTTVVPGGDGEMDLSSLRSAAARFQSDVLVILTTRTNTYFDWNLLAASYLALVPAFFVPGTDLSAYTGAEACALDVRNAVFLACAQGHAHATRRFVTPLRQGQRLRDLVAATTIAALANVPHDLRNAIDARLRVAWQPSKASTRHRPLAPLTSLPEPAGIPYQTGP